MHSDIVTVSPDTTVGEAIDILLNFGVSGLPIVDREKCVLGIITEYAMLAITYDPKIVSDPVSRHMTKDVISVDADDRAQQIADVFILHRIHRVLVKKDGKLVGVISRRDLLKSARKFCKSLTKAPVGSDSLDAASC